MWYLIEGKLGCATPVISIHMNKPIFYTQFYKGVEYFAVAYLKDQYNFLSSVRLYSVK